MDTLQILALMIVLITIFKLGVIVFNKESYNKFLKSYANSISNNSWVYFIIYFLISIISLFLIRTNSTITYTEITALMMFFAFLMNAGLTSMPSIYKNIDISKINWGRVSLYTSVWLFIMFKALREIFNF